VSEIRVVFLGAPGAGKGTQATLLRQQASVTHFSTGDVLRRHRIEKTPLGLQAEACMDRGELVPDALIIALVEAELATTSMFVLDGFPRTLSQAEALDTMLATRCMPLTGVLFFDAPRDLLLRRLTARWVNPRTGRIYNTITDPPRAAGIDDDDGLPLEQRVDDTLETATRRLDVYEQQTAPLIAYYTQRGLLTRINAAADIEDVAAQVRATIPALQRMETHR